MGLKISYLFMFISYLSQLGHKLFEGRELCCTPKCSSQHRCLLDMHGLNYRMTGSPSLKPHLHFHLLSACQKGCLEATSEEVGLPGPLWCPEISWLLEHGSSVYNCLSPNPNPHTWCIVSRSLCHDCQGSNSCSGSS